MAKSFTTELLDIDHRPESKIAKLFESNYDDLRTKSRSIECRTRTKRAHQKICSFAWFQRKPFETSIRPQANDQPNTHFGVTQ